MCAAVRNDLDAFGYSSRRVLDALGWYLFLLNLVLLTAIIMVTCSDALTGAAESFCNLQTTKMSHLG